MPTMFARPLLLVLLLTVAFASTGCQSWTQMKSERDALYHQNRALQDAKDQLAADNARLREAQASRPAPSPAPAPAPAAPATAPAVLGLGFDAITGVEVDHSTAGQVTVRVPGDVLFAPGQVTLTKSAQKTLGEVASVLKRDHAGSRVIVEGHSDSDPIKKSKWASNHALSEARAKSVADYLVARGVSAGQITIVGYGPDRPRGKDKAKNRRVEIVVVK